MSSEMGTPSRAKEELDFDLFPPEKIELVVVVVVLVVGGTGLSMPDAGLLTVERLGEKETLFVAFLSMIGDLDPPERPLDDHPVS